MDNKSLASRQEAFPFLSLPASCLNWQSSLCSYFSQIPFVLRVIYFPQIFASSLFPESHKIFVQLFLITLKMDRSHCPVSTCSRLGSESGLVVQTVRPAASFPLRETSHFSHQCSFILSLLSSFGQY